MSEDTEIASELKELFTPEEVDEWRKTFKQFDKNGNGRIDANELDLVFQEMGLRKSEEEIQQLLTDADVDGNGEMDFDEFLGMIARVTRTTTNRELTQDEVLKSLKVFVDEEGCIEVSDLIYHMTHLGDCPLNEQEVNEIFDMMNFDLLTNQKVNLDVFITEVMNLRFLDL